MRADVDSFRSVTVHASAGAAHQAKLRRGSMETGWVDAAFHYQSVRQAELWMEVHRAHAPVSGREAFREIFHEAAVPVAREAAGRAVHLVGLGAGGGRKEGWILAALRAAGCRVRYTPVDVSVELALESARVADAFLPPGAITPVVADARFLPAQGGWLEPREKEELRIVTAFGVLPNWRPGEAFPVLRGLLRPDDLLLVSANLVPVPDDSVKVAEACEKILPQYDNAETRRWLRQVVMDWGWDAHLGPVRFGVEQLEGVCGLFARCDWIAPWPIPGGGGFPQNTHREPLRLFFSLRYSPKMLEQCLQNHGLRTQSTWVTPCAEEGVWLAWAGESSG